MKNLLLSTLMLVMTNFQFVTAQDNTMPVQQVIQSYLDLKNALVADNGDEARTAAKQLYTMINGMNVKNFTAVQLKAWNQYATKLSSNAEKIKGTAEIENQRENFIRLSESMYKFLKASGMNQSELHYAFCPMADNGKGAYWISEEKTIRNPYYGKKMLTCGSIKETIKAKQ